MYYSLSNITDHGLWNCKIFFSLDLRSRYPHMGLKHKSKPKSVSATTSGKCHWNVAPFRIHSLPGVYCYLMSEVLSGLDFCFIYLNDILVYSVSWEEHLQYLETVLSSKSSKFEGQTQQMLVFKQHLQYLGHLISEQGIQPLLDKIMAIKNLAVSKMLMTFIILLEYLATIEDLYHYLLIWWNPSTNYSRRTQHSNGWHNFSQLLIISRMQSVRNPSYNILT